MDFGSKLEELNLTRDEMNRLGEALKDEKFLELLSEYAAEISSPENRRKYEQELCQLEEQRGVRAEFIHPEPHHALKIEKLFINICSSPLIHKPSCAAATDPSGTPGHNWRLPFSLTAGRPDRDSAGNSCAVHDVIFHPDALHLAENSERLMKLLHSTAIRGIEDNFHIQLETHHIKQLKIKYKGVPQAAVIRRPIPGHQQRNTCEDLLSFPYPDQTQPEPEPEPEPKASSATPPENSRSSSSDQHTKPHYSIKYRSVVDLQDYRCSRDSGPGARPTEIIITVDLPLLRSAGDAEVSVKEQRLVFESQRPAYRLDLPLSYPVDEDKGEAKFNKTKKQLTVTLPVQPVRSAELQQIRCDEVKSNDEEADQKPNEEVPEPQSDCSTLTQPEPSASEPQVTDLTTEPQTLMDPEHICSVETDKDDINVSQPVDSLSNTFSSESEITANGGDEDVHEVSDTLKTENTQAFESLNPHQPLMTDNNTAINQQSSSSTNQQPNQEDLISPEDTEEPETRRSSEERESTAAAADVNLREMEPDAGDVFICSHKTSAALSFQNSLWSDLD